MEKSIFVEAFWYNFDTLVMVYVLSFLDLLCNIFSGL